MRLEDLRNDINAIDEEILALFIKRMGVCQDVAVYKKENNLPVLQGNREEEILRRIRALSPEDLADGAALLFTNIMDISKSLQQQAIRSSFPLTPETFLPENAHRIGCQGVAGSNQEQACRKLFGNKPLTFFNTFGDVFNAVENGEIDYGVLPLINSTAGGVTETYDLMRKFSFFINACVQVEITNCLAVRPGTTLKDIQKVYSHEQALAQCSEFLTKNRLEKSPYMNTAAAAQLVRDSAEPIAAICSEPCAELYGLEILQSRISNVSPNMTKFICISKKFQIPEVPSTVSISLSIPNIKGSLYRLLTKFSVNDLNLEHIESKPIANGSFDVIFYLDFSGDIRQKKVGSLLHELQAEYPTFKFLGNYGDVL